MAERRGMRRQQRALAILSAAGVGAILVGLRMLDGTDLASSWGPAFAGLKSQLPVTLPAALRVLAAAAMQLAAGMVAIRGLRGSPFASPLDAALGGIVGAVIIGVACLMLLGSLGLFRLPILLGVNAVIIGGGWLTRPIVAGTAWFRTDLPTVAGVLVVFAWSGSVILQLASPVVPFIDVLPNHVAPAEHLRAFGTFETLTTAPSPIYGPSRMFLGYTGLLGSATVVSGQSAALAVAAFILPSTVLVAAGMVRLGAAIHGPGNGWWILIAFTLTTSFSRLADARATVVVLPLVAFCFAELLAPSDEAEAGPGRRAAVLTAGLVSTVYLHPLMGALTVGTVAMAIALRPGRHASVGMPALMAVGVLVIPQAVTMAGVAVPSAMGLLVVPPAAAAGWLIVRFSGSLRWWLLALRIALVGSALAFFVLALPSWERWFGVLALFLANYPILLSVLAVGVILYGRRTLSAVLAMAFVTGLLAVLAAAALPVAGVAVAGLDFEVTKTLHYWTPVFLSVAGGFALHAMWEHRVHGRARRTVLRTAVVGLFLLVATLPIRTGPINAFLLGEHRISETLSFDLRAAEYGFWDGYPDSRYVMDPPRTELVERLQEEVAAGRLWATTPVLHLAFSFQQWAATPVGVFGGMVETMVSVETEVSSHTAGGRLHPFSELDAFLADAAAFPYLVFEPAGLPPDTRDRVLAVGYQSIFTNGQGEIFVLPGE